MIIMNLTTQKELKENGDWLGASTTALLLPISSEDHKMKYVSNEWLADTYLKQMQEKGLSIGEEGKVFSNPMANTGMVQNLIFLGLGNPHKITPKTIRKGFLSSLHTAVGLGYKNLIVDWASFEKCLGHRREEVSTENLIPILLNTLVNSDYNLDRFKKDYKKEMGVLKEEKDKNGEKIAAKNNENNDKKISLHFCFSDAKQKRSFENSAKIANALGEAREFCFALANGPGNQITPKKLAQKAQEMGQKMGLKTTILGHDKLVKEKMHGILAVAQGSTQEPFMITLEYKAAAAKKTVAIVGKGLTFDSGGISLKPGAGMEDMKFDMCGAATTLATMYAVALLKLKVNVVAIVGTAENMPSGSALKPGDIITYSNGTTAEIVNTDAEGRLVLADALMLAQKHEPDVLIDLATLTGAITVALGSVAAGLFANDEHLSEALMKASKKSTETLWPMPLFPEYSELTKGKYSDLTNSPGRLGGSCTAAAFLKHFVNPEQNWAHIDIAGVSWDTNHFPGLPEKGGSSFGVGLLVQYLKDQASK